MTANHNDKYEVKELKPYIMWMKIHEDVEVDVQMGYELRAALVEASSTPRYCVLLDGTASFTVTTEARSMMADKEFSSNRIAAAFVITSLANRLLGNFFIKFHKPHAPTKLFTTQEDAVKWLEVQLAEYLEQQRLLELQKQNQVK